MRQDQREKIEMSLGDLLGPIFASLASGDRSSVRPVMNTEGQIAKPSDLLIHNAIYETMAEMTPRSRYMTKWKPRNRAEVIARIMLQQIACQGELGDVLKLLGHIGGPSSLSEIQIMMARIADKQSAYNVPEEPADNQQPGDPNVRAQAGTAPTSAFGREIYNSRQPSGQGQDGRAQGGRVQD